MKSSAEIACSQTTTQTLFGTLFYMAPEMLRSKQRILFREADVWAFGISILILVTQKQPYSGATTREIRQQILDN
jgi:serine/threonine protein kinase